MTLLDKVEAITSNITKANEVWAAMEPLKREFEELSKPLTKLDKTKNYFGVKPDGNALIVSFNLQNGMPEFREAMPLPEDQFAADEAAQAEVDRIAAEQAAAPDTDGAPANIVSLVPQA